jgi:sugar transferase (PEP-CTERM system associated)
MLRIYRHYIPLMLLATVAADVAVIAGAVALAANFAAWSGEGALWPKTVAITSITTLILSVADLYRMGRHISRRELLARIVLALGCAAIIMGAVGYALPALRLGRLAFFQAFALITTGLVGWRLAWFGLRPTDRLRKRTLVLGVGPNTPLIAALQDSGSRPFTVLGFVADEIDAAERLPREFELLGKTGDLLNLVDELQPDLVLVGLADMRRALPVQDLLECRLRGIAVEDWSTFYEKQTGKVLVANLRPSWLIFSDGFVKGPLTTAVKRGVDLLLASVGLALTLPLMALVAVVIKLDSRGPVLFRQARVGQHGRVFVLNKFRSMAADAENGEAVWATQNDPRITRVGRWLRRVRLDELPQFFNVLVGDMSFIGPRPERPQFVRMLQRQLPFYMERHSVKPGITGWAQVKHQYAASVEDSLEKLQYDLYYVKNVSPLLDMLILLSTIQVVLFARGSR